jgi:hypothetical protein
VRSILSAPLRFPSRDGPLIVQIEEDEESERSRAAG